MRKASYFFSGILFILGLASIGYYFYYTNFVEGEKEYLIQDISYTNKVASVTIDGALDGQSCAISSSDKYDWVKIKDNKCEYKLTEKGIYYVYLKINDEVVKLDNKSKVLDILVDVDNYYLALNDSKRIKYRYISIGDEKVNIATSDKNVIALNRGYIKSVDEGEAKITFTAGDLSKDVKVVVTDLIDKMPKKYNYNRSYLSCNKFSSTEANLLDEILFSRVKEAGEKTRAGVVAAARFLTLEFPYRISYFSENGRLGNYSGGPKVDGEGRFYHKGLYLTKDKFDVLDSRYIGEGPNPWGCPIYSIPSKGMRSNGLDCSGFTTWVVYNGGFDIEDLAAHGGDDSIYNLNDIGEERELTLELSLSGEIKAGDLLGEVTVSEGHSAIVIGVDKNNYYVAESLWESPLGVNINTYSKEEFPKKFETVNLMGSVYKEDGNYTAMWY